jgi:hypothetical protein
MTNFMHVLRVNHPTHGMVTLRFETDFNPYTDVSIENGNVTGVGRILPETFLLQDNTGKPLIPEVDLPYYMNIATDEVYNKIVGIEARLREQLNNPK